MPCPKCFQESGRVCRVESKTSVLVVVSLRCSDCEHEWTVQRETPLVLPIADPRIPPEEPAS